VASSNGNRISICMAFLHTRTALAQQHGRTHTRLQIFIFSSNSFLFYFGRFSANRKIDSADVCERCLYTENNFSRILHGHAQSENQRIGAREMRRLSPKPRQNSSQRGEPTDRSLENRSARRKVKNTTETSLGKSIFTEQRSSDPAIHRRHAQ